jgi:hypothetical protein
MELYPACAADQAKPGAKAHPQRGGGACPSLRRGQK